MAQSSSSSAAWISGQPLHNRDDGDRPAFELVLDKDGAIWVFDRPDTLLHDVEVALMDGVVLWTWVVSLGVLLFLGDRNFASAPSRAQIEERLAASEPMNIGRRIARFLDLRPLIPDTDPQRLQHVIDVTGGNAMALQESPVRVDATQLVRVIHDP